MVFLLETLVWQKGFDPKKKAQHMALKPELFTPDFMKNVADTEIKKDVVSMDIDEVKAFLNKPRVEAK